MQYAINQDTEMKFSPAEDLVGLPDWAIDERGERAFFVFRDADGGRHKFCCRVELLKAMIDSLEVIMRLGVEKQSIASGAKPYVFETDFMEGAISRENAELTLIMTTPNKVKFQTTFGNRMTVRLARACEDAIRMQKSLAGRDSQH